MSDSVRPHRWQPTRMPCPWDSPGKNTGVGCHFFLQCMKVKSESEVAQLCLTLSNPIDCSLPGSSIHGIFQARVLEWGAIAFSERVSSDSQFFILKIGNIFFLYLLTNPSNHLSILLIFLEPIFAFVSFLLEKEMATHSSVLAWRIPRTGASWAAVYGVPQSWTQLK